jgi:chaperonin cofactor prefoldin
MGDNMSSEFEKLKTDRKLLRERIGRTMIEKEMTAAQSDLQDARDSLEMIKHKWARLQREESPRPAGSDQRTLL